MRDLKYVIFSIGKDNLIYRAILFNGMFIHKDIADSQTKYPDVKAIAAGFTNITNIVNEQHGISFIKQGLPKNGRPLITKVKVKAYGNSESLKLESRGVLDEIIIENTLNRMDY